MAKEDFNHGISSWKALCEFLEISESDQQRFENFALIEKDMSEEDIVNCSIQELEELKISFQHEYTAEFLNEEDY